MADNIAKVVMLDRSVYDAQTHDTNTIYFVREGTPSLSNVLSLYVGDAFQCDLLYIDENEVTFDQTSNEYNLPEKYHIKNKLLFYKQSIVTDKIDSSTNETYDFFRICMWDGEKFRDTGLPNNLIVCSEHLPDTSKGIKDFAYIDVMNRNIYVFDGNSYIPIIELSQYATKEWVEDYHNSHQQAVYVDGVTVLKTDEEVLHGAGADVSGITVTKTSGGTTTTEKAAKNAYVFNDVGNTDRTMAMYPCSSVFGYLNTEYGSAGSGYNPQDPSYAPYDYGCNIISGYNNKVQGASKSFVSGHSNEIKSTDVFNNLSVFGYLNILNLPGSRTSSSSMLISGNEHRLTIQSKISGYIFNSGYRNNFTIDSERTDTDCHVSIFGCNNNVHNPDSRSYPDPLFVAGKNNTTYDFNGCIILGNENNLKLTNDVSQTYSQAISAGGTSLIGFGNVVTGQLSYSSIIGKANIVTISNNSSEQSSFIVGNGNTLNVSQGIQSGNNVILGHNIHITDCSNSNIIGTGNLCSHSDCVVIGNALQSTSDGMTIIGQFNSTQTNVLDPKFVIGNGYYTQDHSGNRNALIIDSQNDIYTYGNTYTTGNVESVTNGVSLVSDIISTTITPANNIYVLDHLPSNNDNTVINKSSTVGQITISDLHTLLSDGTNVAVEDLTDYCSTITFRKDSTLSSVTDILTNFTPNSVGTNNESNRIYLLNPDIDISSYTVIQLLLFYDGFNVCCTVGGYEEDVTP